MNRRGFIAGLLSAPAVITTPGLLMPVRAWRNRLMRCWRFSKQEGG